MEIQAQYPIYIGENHLREFNGILEEYSDKYSNVFIVVDENTREHCLPVLLEQVPYLEGYDIIEIPAGEEHKTIEICCGIWETLTEAHADRQALLVNLGGGVLCDMAGFAAASYKRGIRFVHIPTTLLSQVDASVGSKVGIDFGGFKNQIGAFADPMMVLVEPEFLTTLDQRQWLSGFAEIIKHALIADKTYWDLIVKGFEPALLMDYIYQSILIKKEVVLNDPKESGLRKILNFGHSVGHAIESHYLNTEEPLLHGEAVAIGMIAEAYLSMEFAGLPENDFRIIEDFILMNYSIKKIEQEEITKIVKWVHQDKKNKDSDLRFTLISEIGKAVYDITIPEEKVIESIQYLIEKHD
jgi:3-dehydroquinate synthase